MNHEEHCNEMAWTELLTDLGKFTKAIGDLSDSIELTTLSDTELRVRANYSPERFAKLKHDQQVARDGLLAFQRMLALVRYNIAESSSTDQDVAKLLAMQAEAWLAERTTELGSTV